MKSLHHRQKDVLKGGKEANQYVITWVMQARKQMGLVGIGIVGELKTRETGADDLKLYY